MTQTLVDISLAESLLATMPLNIDKLQAAIASLDVESNNTCVNAVLAEYHLSLAQLQKEEQQWIKSYLVPAECASAEMTAVDCSNWITQTSSLPDCLSQDTIARYKAAGEIIQNRLRQCRVVGVITMFNELTPSEQDEFLQAIHTVTNG